MILLDRRSLTDETRLFKYSKRGFAVAVSELDKSRINIAAVLRSAYGQPRGLIGLLRLDHKYNTGSNQQPRFRGIGRGRTPEDDYSESQEEAQNIPGDYVPYIPWGPRWTVKSIRSHLNRQVRFFLLQ